jgi:hypothetical protein
MKGLSWKCLFRSACILSICQPAQPAPVLICRRAGQRVGSGAYMVYRCADSRSRLPATSRRERREDPKTILRDFTISTSKMAGNGRNRFPKPYPLHTGVTGEAHKFYAYAC